ncbi:hypothetical protein OPV22_019736 [Ensete ventricosum]|uniref:Uncharacterized protein n=1 Tax=Ensete ventricosum TaxID=4639 RepID=A0AAV8QHN3_ENSVE|nr:hypothetical protein OPV22_019736 [Ensete ventricosum]
MPTLKTSALVVEDHQIVSFTGCRTLFLVLCRKSYGRERVLIRSLSRDHHLSISFDAEKECRAFRGDKDIHVSLLICNNPWERSHNDDTAFSDRAEQCLRGTREKTTTEA